MSNRTNEIFIGPSFKKWYIGITLGVCIVWTLITFVTYLCGNDLMVNGGTLFGYYNALVIIFAIISLYLEEKIRKYPGVLSVVCISIYYFCYIVLCMLRVDFTIFSILISVGYLLFIGISLLIYKLLIPLIVVKKNGLQIFNFIYLMFLVNLTLIVGAFLMEVIK